MSFIERLMNANIYISLTYEYAYHYQPNIVKHVKNENSHF